MILVRHTDDQIDLRVGFTEIGGEDTVHLSPFLRVKRLLQGVEGNRIIFQLRVLDHT